MGTAAYSIHCWQITRLYVFYHKRYGIDGTHRLTLLLRILYGFPCATRFPVPYRNNVICLVHHITIALVHTIRRITLLQERFFVAFGGYIKVPIPECLAPFRGVADGLFCREIDGLFCRSSPDIIVRRRCVLSHKRRGWLQPSPSFRYSRNLALQDELYHPVINNGPAVLVCVDKRLGTGPVNQSRDAG